MICFSHVAEIFNLITLRFSLPFFSSTNIQTFLNQDTFTAEEKVTRCSKQEGISVSELREILTPPADISSLSTNSLQSHHFSLISSVTCVSPVNLCRKAEEEHLWWSDFVELLTVLAKQLSGNAVSVLLCSWWNALWEHYFCADWWLVCEEYKTHNAIDLGSLPLIDFSSFSS